MLYFNSCLFSDNLNSTKLTTEIVIPVSSSPELVLIGYNRNIITLNSMSFSCILILALLNPNK